MRTFFIFIKCRLGKAYDVAGAIVDSIEPCPHVHSISGEYDLLCQFTVESTVDIGRFVNTHVHAIPDIVDTKTMIAFNAFSQDKGLPSDSP